MRIADFHIEHRQEKITISHCPVLGWHLESDQKDVYQESYHIRIKKDTLVIWDSGEECSEACVGIICGGEYMPYQKYEIVLRVKDTCGETAEARLEFLSGRMQTEWQADWITGSGAIDEDAVKPTYIFQKGIRIKGKVARAIISASALGCYDLYINGRNVGNRYFAPGYTQYTSRVLYQTYDVTEWMQADNCIIEAEVAGGWYTGRLGLVLDGNRFGAKRAFIMELFLLYEDGRTETLTTDRTWNVTTGGPRRFAGFFDGERYDARLCDRRAWVWENAQNLDRNAADQCIPAMEEDMGAPVLAHEKIIPKLISATEEELIFDVGRNLAGIVCIRNISGEEGEELTVRHGEILHEGKVYTANLRTAQASLEYICRDGVNSFEPRFTYMGFRYFSATRDNRDRLHELTEQNFVVCELYSRMETIGHFSCSYQWLNQLQENILTSQKANFIDIPTDCPQRDERCGWTGDITVFSSTALYNMECSRFLRKWLKDVRILQKENGKGFAPYIVPDNGMGRKPGGGMWGKSEHSGVDAVWGDAAVLIPWNLYWSTGEKAVLEESYEGMTSQVDYVKNLMGPGERDRNFIWKKGMQLGDWLAPNEGILKNMSKAKWTSTVYWANSAHITAMAAKILGKDEDAAYYERLYRKICEAFVRKFVKKGHIRNGFQSIYALAICFGILNGELAENAAEDLAEDVRRHGNHLTTGFVGTPFLPFALADSGNVDAAYDILLQDTFPSWLYPVKTGATSIWERWDSLKPDGTVNHGKGGEDMVSFNHYSYGAVGDFLYRRVCGLEALEAGYKKFRVAPCPGGGLRWAETTHKCPYGEIIVRWRIDTEQGTGRFHLDFIVPVNTTAQIMMPDGTRQEYGSGEYHLEATYEEKNICNF